MGWLGPVQRAFQVELLEHQNLITIAQGSPAMAGSEGYASTSVQPEFQLDMNIWAMASEMEMHSVPIARCAIGHGRPISPCLFCFSPHPAL